MKKYEDSFQSRVQYAKRNIQKCWNAKEISHENPPIGLTLARRIFQQWSLIRFSKTNGSHFLWTSNISKMITLHIAVSTILLLGMNISPVTEDFVNQSDKSIFQFYPYNKLKSTFLKFLLSSFKLKWKLVQVRYIEDFWT